MLGHTRDADQRGLPSFLVEQARRQVDFRKTTVGILGMAFKAESDDHRDSLAYKLEEAPDRCTRSA